MPGLSSASPPIALLFAMTGFFELSNPFTFSPLTDSPRKKGGEGGFEKVFSSNT